MKFSFKKCIEIPIASTPSFYGYFRYRRKKENELGYYYEGHLSGASLFAVNSTTVKM